MRRHASLLWLVAALSLPAASAPAGAVSNYDRFELWNECKPMTLIVEDVHEDATAIGLTKESIEAGVLSKLRAARLYNSEEEWSHLTVLVNVAGRAFSIRLLYNKRMQDVATGMEGLSVSWFMTSTGMFGDGGVAFILSGVTQNIDAFINEYLRVNADACE